MSARNKMLIFQSLLIATSAIVLVQFMQGILVRTAVASLALLIFAIWIPTKNERNDLMDIAKGFISKNKPN